MECGNAKWVNCWLRMRKERCGKRKNKTWAVHRNAKLHSYKIGKRRSLWNWCKLDGTNRLGLD